MRRRTPNSVSRAMRFGVADVAEVGTDLSGSSGVLIEVDAGRRSQLIDHVAIGVRGELHQLVTRTAAPRRRREREGSRHTTLRSVVGWGLGVGGHYRSAVLQRAEQRAVAVGGRGAGGRALRQQSRAEQPGRQQAGSRQAGRSHAAAAA